MLACNHGAHSKPHPIILDPIHLVKSLQTLQSSHDATVEDPDGIWDCKHLPSRRALEDFSVGVGL